MIRASPKLFHDRWALYLPSGASSLALSDNLAHSLVTDPSSKVRERLAATLATFVELSKSFLAAANDRYVGGGGCCR